MAPARAEFLKPYWDPISDGAKNFIKRMLVVDPKKRATIDDLLKDPWLTGLASSGAAYNLEESAEYHLKMTEEQLNRQTHTKTQPNAKQHKKEVKEQNPMPKGADAEQVQVEVDKDGGAGCACVIM